MRRRAHLIGRTSSKKSPTPSSLRQCHRGQPAKRLEILQLLQLLTPEFSLNCSAPFSLSQRIINVRRPDLTEPGGERAS
jgi:hypothetical protein